MAILPAWRTQALANLAAWREIAMTSSHGSCDDCVSFYIVDNGRTHSLSYPSFLLGDDAGSERNPPPHDVFRRMRAEQPADSNVDGDVADDPTNQWCENKGWDNHALFTRSLLPIQRLSFANYKYNVRRECIINCMQLGTHVYLKTA